jgi:copper(I)-binding protein
MMRQCILVATLALAAANAASGSAQEYTVGDLAIARPWARATTPVAKTGAVYMTLTNRGATADRLVGAASEVAEQARLHTHLVQGDVVRMRPVEAIEIVPGVPTVLRPGGLHIMLTRLERPLHEGDAFSLRLSFEKAGAVEVRVVVEKPGAMGGHGKHK